MTNLAARITSALGAAFLFAPFAYSGVPASALNSQVVFLGEQHDNPGHHEVQAEWVAAISPVAVVFEMLTPEQAMAVTPDNRGDQVALEAALGWEAAGWPDFSMYFPIFSAAPNAKVKGAGVPREQTRSLMNKDVSDVFGAELAVRFGLDSALPEDQQEKREALQRAAHCDALPESMLPMMVDVQRLRDAVLAATALDALETIGAPVVVITGNGHVRNDWGAPALLRYAASDVSVFTLGQGEAGQTPTGGFDFTLDGPAVDRGDPCDAFK